MSHLKQIFAAFCLSVILISCEKIDGPAGNVFKIWEVTDFVAINDSLSNENDEPIYFTINTDKSYELQLNVNTCVGSILTITDKHLNLSPPTCTEICCDTPFASRLAELIPQISMYKVSGSTLRLYIPNWGFIECELAE